MIPYFSWTTIELGPISLQVWGIFVSLGVIASLILALYLAEKKQLNKDIIWDLYVWLILGGIFGGRMFYVFYYNPQLFSVNQLEIFRIWHGGASSLGGFIGAISALLIYVKVKKISFKDFKPYAGILGVSLWLGWAIGRIGCFMIHDHPGRLSDFFLAVNFVDGARHDLGLYESLLSFAVFALAIFLYKKYQEDKPGRILLWTFLVFSFVRFWLDFLRADDLNWSDPRYYWFTPAQWGIVIFFLLTIIVFLRKIWQAWQMLAKK